MSDLDIAQLEMRSRVCGPAAGTRGSVERKRRGVSVEQSTEPEAPAGVAYIVVLRAQEPFVDGVHLARRPSTPSR